MDFRAQDRIGTACSKWDGREDKFGKADLVPLWVADMDFAVAEAVQEAISKRAKHPVYGYTLYDEGFFQSIVDWYALQLGWKIDREWIVPEHGVVVSINLAIEAFSNEGDGIIVQTPIYPPFLSSIKNHERRVLENRIVFEEGKSYIDFEDFEEQAKQAKLFLLCSPHNPSTRAWTKAELSQMLSICQEHNVLIISDEIHSDLVFGSSHIPVASLPSAEDTVLTLHAPSKTFNIAGLNTSYLVIQNSNLRQKYLKEHHRAGLDNGNLFGVVALQSAYTKGDEWLKSLKEQLASNSLFIQEFISQRLPEIVVYEHQATFLMWLDCRGLGLNDKRLSEFFIYKAGLGLNSGISFGEAGSGFMRLNIGTSKAILQKAMDKLESAIKELRSI